MTSEIGVEFLVQNFHNPKFREKLFEFIHATSSAQLGHDTIGPRVKALQSAAGR